MLTPVFKSRSHRIRYKQQAAEWRKMEALGIQFKEPSSPSPKGTIGMRMEFRGKLIAEIVVPEARLIIDTHSGENGCRRMRKVAEIASRLLELKTLAPQAP